MKDESLNCYDYWPLNKIVSSMSTLTENWLNIKHKLC